MASYDAGAARAVYSLDTAQFDASIQRAIASYRQLAAAQQQALSRAVVPAAQAPTFQSSQIQAVQASVSALAGAGQRAAAALSPLDAELNQLRASASGNEAVFLQLAGALSQEAFAAGNAARAEQILENANRGLIATASQVAQATTGGTRAALQQAQAEARLQVALGNRSNAARIIAAELARQEQRTLQVVAAERQLAAVQGQLARSGQGLGQTFGQLQTTIGGLGIAFGTQQLVQFGIESAKASLELDHIERVTRAVAGSTVVYNEIMAEARAQQALFGGSLAENIEGLSGLAVTSKNTGASLSQLVDIQKRLTILNPAQGAKGGLIALNEALAGNISSLQRRFNIPRTELKLLSDTALPVAERLRVIDTFLNKVGITAEAVSGSVGKEAIAFNEASAAIDNANVALGKLIVLKVAPFAQDVTNTANALKSLGDGDIIGAIGNVSGSLLELKRQLSVSPEIQALGLLRGAVDGVIERINRLAGTDIPDIAAPARAALGIYPSLFQSLREGRSITEAFAIAGQEAIRASEGQAAAAARQEAQVAFLDQRHEEQLGIITELTSAEIAAALVEQRHGEQMTGTGNAAERLTRLLTESAQQSLADADAKRTQAAQIELVQLKANDAVDAFFRLHPNIDATGAAAIAAAQNMDPFIAQLIQARLKADEATGALQRFQLGSAGALAFAPGSNALPGTRARGSKGQTLGDIFGGGAQEKIRDTIQKQNDLHEAQLQLDLARARTAEQRIAILQRELGVTTNQADKLRILAQIEGERTSAAKGRGGPGGRGLAALDRTEITLAGDLDAQLAEVNARLAQGNLTQLQRNQLLEKQRDLEEKIANEKERANKAAIDAQLDIVHDAQKRLEEAREEAAARRAIASASTSQEQKQAAALRLQEIQLEQQKRALDIAGEIKTAGGVLPPTGAPPTATGATPTPIGVPQVAPGVPIPFVPPSAIAAPPPVTVNLSITVTADGRIIQQKADPNVVLNLLRGAVQAIPGGP